MRTLSKILCGAMLAVGISGSVQAAPGDAVPGIEAEQTERVTVIESAKASCASRGGLCITAGALNTRPVAEMLAAGAGAPIGSDSSTLFLRLIESGPSQRYDAEDVPWTLDVSAAFRRPALSGNALFLFTDIADAEQTAASHTVTALYQTPIAAGERAAVRLQLSPQDGFRTGHTYRLRIVQLIDGKEVELSRGEVGLL